MIGSGFLNDFKNAFSKPNNAHAQLIIINVVVFLFMAVLYVVSAISGFDILTPVYKQFAIPSVFGEFIYRPWTLLTYAFAHDLGDIFHILFNMLIFYWFAKLVIEYLGSDKVISLYVLGALAGGLLYLLLFNTIPFFIAKPSLMVGASAAVYAVAVAAATLVPNHTFYLLFLGPVRIKYIAAFYIVISFIGSVGDNAGGNVAHLGGALMGFVYIKQLQQGNDWGKWVVSTITFIKSFFVKQPNIKVSYKKKATSKKSSTSRTSSSSSSANASQDEIDEILDKISERGYESLTKEEKQKLFNASKK